MKPKIFLSLPTRQTRYMNFLKMDKLDSPFSVCKRKLASVEISTLESPFISHFVWRLWGTIVRKAALHLFCYGIKYLLPTTYLLLSGQEHNNEYLRTTLLQAGFCAAVGRLSWVSAKRRLRREKSEPCIFRFRFSVSRRQMTSEEQVEKENFCICLLAKM